MPASKPTPPVTRRWLSTTELIESQGVSRALIGQLKRTGILKPGEHYLRAGVNKTSRLQWLESAVETTLIAQTIELEVEAHEVIE